MFYRPAAPNRYTKDYYYSKTGAEYFLKNLTPQPFLAMVILKLSKHRKKYKRKFLAMFWQLPRVAYNNTFYLLDMHDLN